DRVTGDLCDFGEDVDAYRDGRLFGHEGSWRAGRDGATHGILVAAKPRPGGRYAQERAPGRAMDRARVISTLETTRVPAGLFENCLWTEETSPLEPGVREQKLFAPHVGLVVDGKLRLVRYGRAAR